MCNENRNADPTSLTIARAIQDAVQNSTIILFGSRAKGTHHEDSDVDILLIYNKDHVAEISRAQRAAQAQMNRNPPKLKVDIVSMEAGRFHYCRRAQNHLAGQAARKGIIMAPEKLEYAGNYDDEYPVNWPDVKEKVLAAYRNIRTFEREFHHPEGEQESYGFNAQQAVENSLKAWVSAAGLTYSRIHDLNDMVGEILNHQTESATLAAEQLKKIMEYSTVEDPENPGETINWLTRYAVQYRYEETRHTMNEAEKTRFRDEILLSSYTFINRAQELTNTTDNDLR